jgi:Na+-driven multidrug efflux pump
VIGRILSIAVPSIAMVAVGSVMTYGFNRILFTFTPIAVSVFGIFYKVQSMAFMWINGH